MTSLKEQLVKATEGYYRRQKSNNESLARWIVESKGDEDLQEELLSAAGQGHTAAILEYRSNELPLFGAHYSNAIEKACTMLGERYHGVIFKPTRIESYFIAIEADWGTDLIQE